MRWVFKNTSASSQPLPRSVYGLGSHTRKIAPLLPWATRQLSPSALKQQHDFFFVAPDRQGNRECRFAGEFRGRGLRVTLIRPTCIPNPSSLSWNILGISTALRQRAERANQVWSWDIIHDQTEAGSTLRILTLIDEYTKQCLTIEVGRSIRAADAIRVLDRVIERYGQPEQIRSDNGPEFIAQAIRQWMSTSQIQSFYIQPGSPWEQAYIESFHDKFRDECLNRELFATLAEARVVIESWRREYNQQRPHSALGYLTPDEFGALQPGATTSCERQNGWLKTKGTRWTSVTLGSNARLIHNRLSPARRAAATSRTRTGHSRSTPARGDYG